MWSTLAPPASNDDGEEEGKRARADGCGSMVEEVRCSRERCWNHALQSSDGDKIGDDTGSYQDEFGGVGVRV